jgi:hypothetical protein
MKTLGLCYIGQHVKKVGFVLLQFASDGGAYPSLSMVGPVVSISNEVMENDGLAAVLHYLRNPPAPDSKRLCFHEEATKKEMSKIKRNHVLVSVELLKGESEEMKLIPLHAGRGWQFDARAEEVRVFPLPASNTGFMKHLNEALEMAS